jgi:hypothetical protein
VVFAGIPKSTASALHLGESRFVHLNANCAQSLDVVDMPSLLRRIPLQDGSEEMHFIQGLAWSKE